MRQSIFTVAALAAIAAAQPAPAPVPVVDETFPAPYPADCTALSAAVFGAISVDDCNANPEFAINFWSHFENSDLVIEQVPVTSGDYVLNLLRPFSDVFGQNVSNDSTPVLLTHCNFQDAW